MGARIKAAMLLLLTLMLGGITGAAVTGAIYRERLEYVASFASSEGFVARFVEILGTLTEEQSRQVMPLLQQAGADIDAMVVAVGGEYQSIMDRLIEDVSVHLTDEQVAELHARRENIRKRYIGRYTIITDEDLSDRQ